MICACGVYYFSAPFDRFIIRSRRRDGSDVGRMRNVPCPVVPPVPLTRLRSLIMRLFWMRRACQLGEKLLFLLLRHKPGIFVIRQAGRPWH